MGGVQDGQGAPVVDLTGDQERKEADVPMADAAVGPKNVPTRVQKQVFLVFFDNFLEFVLFLREQDNLVKVLI